MLSALPVIDHYPGPVGLESGPLHRQVGDVASIGTVLRSSFVGIVFTQLHGPVPAGVNQPYVIAGSNCRGYIRISHKCQFSAIGAQVVILEAAQ